jgi:ribonuclease P/MRP protein subunit RPP40
MIDEDRKSFEDHGLILYEWLSLLSLESPRIEPEDNIDPYLARYRGADNASDYIQVCKISWKGLIGTSWFRDLVQDVLAACPKQTWLSIHASSSRCAKIDGNLGLTLLRPSGLEDQYVMWQIKGL